MRHVSCLRLDEPPRGGVVVAVVSNVDHLHRGEATRTTEHDYYRLRLVSGVSGTADVDAQRL